MLNVLGQIAIYTGKGGKNPLSTAAVTGAVSYTKPASAGTV